MLTIGPYTIAPALALAPMAGITDQPFRLLCRRLGAGLAVSEMVTADRRLWHSVKSRNRLRHDGEPGPISVQIAGSEPGQLADAARANVDLGAQIIDINMGCPAKKVCNKAAGSALLADEARVERILSAVVAAVNVPVTLKIRTGPSPDRRNGTQIARIAEGCGIQALAVHGRTRACRFRGDAEYNTIADICRAVRIPVLANGDIADGPSAALVLAYTGAAGLMFGRSAQGNPWIFREVAHYLNTGQTLPPPGAQERCAVMQEHLQALHHFYGDYLGVRIARKHIGWYLQNQPGELPRSMRRTFNTLTGPAEQLRLIEQYFHQLSVEEQHAESELSFNSQQEDEQAA